MVSHVHQPLEDAEFEFILAAAAGTPVLAFFRGSWPKAVAACRTMDPVVGDAAHAHGGRLTAVRVDMTRCPAATRRYEVASAPTVVLIKDGVAVASHAGALDHAGLAEFLAAAL
ncbi:thiol reductase thioredoxin [Streptomyces venezuelae]|uniref:Thiol reductase thioredoxin n=1 Tax=Streptomyces venezuelae TaxID=54571 RepID=A0A5P2DBA6_STRVZ|nr:thioredoxin family protein [Streptomyces venezuelae]QES51497.1 thiol reductase thioredoxin [Streptomyces venezuelae]